MLTATQLAFQNLFPDRPFAVSDCICAFCGGVAYGDIKLKLSDKFTNHDKLYPSGVVCTACAWFMQNDLNAELQAILGKEIPQKPRNYSWVVKHGQTRILSKGQKRDIYVALAEPPFPQVACIADSGQKHLMFITPVNPEGCDAGMVRFESHTFFVVGEEFATLGSHVGALYRAGFTKGSILTGDYTFYPNSDMEAFERYEPLVKPYRGSQLLTLVCFLMTKEEVVNG